MVHLHHIKITHVIYRQTYRHPVTDIDTDMDTHRRTQPYTPPRAMDNTLLLIIHNVIFSAGMGLLTPRLAGIVGSSVNFTTYK